MTVSTTRRRPPARGTAGGDSSELRAELARLRQRVAELEAPRPQCLHICESNDVGVFVADRAGPEDRAAAREHLRAALERPGEVATWRLRKIRKDGGRLWVEETARVVEEPGRTVVLVLCEDVSERVEAERELACYQRRLRQLSSELTLAEERERRRIADGLHDQVGQILATAKIALGALPEPDCAAAAELDRLLGRALEETRSLSFELSCPVLYKLGLEPALEDLAERLGRRHGVRFRFAADRRSKPLALDASVMLFRVVRELLFNVVKHARVSEARLSVARAGGEIRITVEDRGEGFDLGEHGAGSHAGGLGLFSVRERLDHVGGRLEVRSAPGRGTRMVVVAPLEIAGSSGAEAEGDDSRPAALSRPGKEAAR